MSILPVTFAAVVLGATLQQSPAPGIVCETQQVPRRINRSVEILDTVALCYPVEQAGDAGSRQLAKLHSACELLITAYGPADGRRRCRDLIRRSGAPPDSTR